MRTLRNAILLVAVYILCSGCASTEPLGRQDQLDVIRALKPEAFTEVGLYRVKPGDTAMKIAKFNNLTVDELRSMNPDVNWGKLKVWQVVRIRNSELNPKVQGNTEPNKSSEAIGADAPQPQR